MSDQLPGGAASVSYRNFQSMRMRAEIPVTFPVRCFIIKEKQEEEGD